jgi:hypothetical protein
MFSTRTLMQVSSNKLGVSLKVRRRERLGGLLHEYERAA